MLFVLAWIACDDTVFGPVGATPPGPVDDPSPPTWYTDVLPIVEENCASCHVAGGIAPFALDTYPAASLMAESMSASVQSGNMPPWSPSSDCNTYLGERGLTAAEKSTLARWAAAGGPEGSATDAVHGEPATGGIARVDATLSLPAPYTPITDPDDYRCFLLDVTTPVDGFVTGFSVEPDQKSIVHHVIAYLAKPDQVADYQALDAADSGPGWSCFGGPGGDDALSWLGGWVPGSLGDTYPAGTGIPVPKGSKAVVQMHYNTSSAPAVPDQTSLSFMFDKTVAKPAMMVKVVDPDWVSGGMRIPAGESDVVFSVDLPNPLRRDVKVWSASLHQHLIGKSGGLVVHHADRDTCALEIPRWDFHWQGNYFLKEPITVGADDTVELTCHFDASGSAVDVNWGEGSQDEMCLGLLYVTLE